MEYPKEGEAFELTLDGDAPENAPLEVVRSFGYDPTGWSHNGPTVTGKQTRQFMLVGIGYQPNLAAAKSALEAKYGPTPEGQWMKAFKDAYPEANGVNPVGVADASWVLPNGCAYFPFVSSGGKPYFRWTVSYLVEGWLWLVPAPAPGK